MIHHLFGYALPELKALRASFKMDEFLARRADKYFDYGEHPYIGALAGIGTRRAIFWSHKALRNALQVPKVAWVLQERREHHD